MLTVSCLVSTVGYSWGFNHGLSDTSADEEEEEEAA